jgi:hypothetical protein
VPETTSRVALQIMIVRAVYRAELRRMSPSAGTDAGEIRRLEQMRGECLRILDATAEELTPEDADLAALLGEARDEVSGERQPARDR